MARELPRDIQLLLQRIHGRLGGHPARDVALWLACIPFVLPAHLVAGAIAVSRRRKGDLDPRWRLVLLISFVNFLVSAIVLSLLYSIIGDWIIVRLEELLGPFFLWPSNPGSSVTEV